MKTSPTLPDDKSSEKITPFIENAILELVALCAKLVSTPFAVLLNTADYRAQLAAFHKDELNSRHSPTVARPLSFYVLWMAAHFLLAKTYWHYISRDGVRPGQISQQVPAQIKRAAGFLKDHNWADLTGTAQALLIIAFAVTLIIAVKSILVSMIGRAIGCPIRFRTVLFGSAYTMGTLLFFQYAAILSQHAISSLTGYRDQYSIGYFMLVYGSLFVCIILAIRINQLIVLVDGTAEGPTFITWFAGTMIWLYLIVMATGALLKVDLTVVVFAKLAIRMFIPSLFPDLSL